ncbi:LRR receptor-like serine/threonine-protein kinase FLS2 [Hibiscus syriacus]|uniref:LRR receptor-like serine/threonine-protein kinase FLS2 n=1 Tax=Hibiscus syriacus TaxID=106335 RepID=UPI001924A055|nr:LRR receptor-like serine/threonine-protein kinase FLS2 [Hibiscus syriacus]
MANTFFYLALLTIIFHLPIPTFSMELTTILTDQSALLALKHHVVHDPENVLATNWSTSAPVCNWFGVKWIQAPQNHSSKPYWFRTCRHPSTPLGKFIIPLSSVDRNFNGEIPSWLGSLTELRELYLYRNNFKGVVPFSLGFLPKLEILRLFRNQISELIDFTANNLTGRIPKDMFDLLPNLKTLFLSGNMLSGRIPASLFKCKELRFLSLSFNQLEGSLPVEIGNLSEIPEQVVNLTLLEQFDVTSNNLTGTIPREIGNLKNLGLLNLAANNIAGPLSGHLPSTMGLWLPNLEVLYLGGNHFVGPFPMSISNASQLAILDCQKFEVLNLEYNNLTSSGMSFLSSLPNCRGLEMLDFRYNPLVSGELPVEVLTSMDLSTISFSSDIPTGVADLNDLTYFPYPNRSQEEKAKLVTRADLLPLGTWKRISYLELHLATDGFSDNIYLAMGVMVRVPRDSLRRVNICSKGLQVRVRRRF